MAVLDEAGYGKLGPERATELCATAFTHRGLDLKRVGEVSVVLVKPELMQSLNLKFRNIDAPTDVLSFDIDGPYGEMVGEILVCPERASVEVGVEELVAHGALHLCGMEHGEEFDGSEMARAQEVVMGSVRGPEG